MSSLSFNRKQFPIPLWSDKNGSAGLGTVVIPPYHPSMIKTGINFRLVPTLLDEVVKETVNEIEEIAAKIRNFRYYLKDIRKDKSTGKIAYAARIDLNEYGVKIEGVPIVKHFWVSSNEINPLGQSIDGGIAIDPRLSSKKFFLFQ